MTMRNTLRTLFTFTIYVGMIVLCIAWQNAGGLGGIIGGGVGFLLRFFEGGQRSTEERFGNGYAGSLIGLPIGFIIGAATFYVAAHWHEWVGS